MFLALAFAFAPSLGAAPSIVHSGLECIAPSRFAVVLSGIDPESEIQTAKVYFRSELYPDFYYVVMKLEGERFVGILPQAAPSTPRVIYYLEAVDQAFDSVRSEEFAPVVGECDDDPALAYLAGGTPEIVVGATTAGAATLPPGFAAAGIVGTIASTGVASGIGGGIGTGVAVAGAAGAAGAAAAVVVAGQGEASTSTAAAAPPTSSVTTSTPAGGGPSSTSPTTSVGASPTTSISNTTTVPGGSTTTSTPGGSTSSTTTTTTGGSTTSTTTSSSSTTTSPSSTTTTTVSPLNADCFTVEIKGPCDVKVNAKCVDDPVDRYDWVLDTQNKFQRIDIIDGKKEEKHKWSSAVCSQNESITFRLTVYRGGFSSTAEKTVLVPASLTVGPGLQPVELRMDTRLEIASPDDRSRVRIQVDGRLAGAIVAGQPLSVRMLLSPGPHEIEGVVLRSPGESGLWSLDFSGTSAFREGTLRVLQGTVLAMGQRTVTFRLSGQPEERLRLRFELQP